jgi:hypothetical protein
MRDLHDLGASPAKCVHQWSIRVRPYAVQIGVVKEPLKASIDAIAALVLEQTKNLRSRDQSIVSDGT